MADETAATIGNPFASDASRAAWLETGAIPTPSDAVADSSPAEPAEQAASTDASLTAASEPAKPAEKKATPGLDARETEVHARIARLKESLALADHLEKQLQAKTQPKSDAPKAESSTAATVGLTKAEYQTYLDMPDAPKLGDFQEIEHHTAAMALFIARKEADATFERKFGEISKSASERETRLRDVSERVGRADAAYKAYLEATPDADQKIDPRLAQIVPASLLEHPAEAKPHNILADAVMDSGVPGQLHAYFSTPDGTKHWQSLLRLAGNPQAVAFEFGKLAARFDSRAASSATPPKTVSTAPEPVEPLGKRPAAPPDDAESALLSGDFEAYERAMNARDFAARRTA